MLILEHTVYLLESCVASALNTLIYCTRRDETLILLFSLRNSMPKSINLINTNCINIVGEATDMFRVENNEFLILLVLWQWVLILHAFWSVKICEVRYQWHLSNIWFHWNTENKDMINKLKCETYSLWLCSIFVCLWLCLLSTYICIVFLYKLYPGYSLSLIEILLETLKLKLIMVMLFYSTVSCPWTIKFPLI